MNAKNGQNGRNGPNGQNRPDGPAEPDRGEGKAMSSLAAGRVYGQHSGYRNLKAYQVAELLYDFTCRFCARYVPNTPPFPRPPVLS